mgnify:CR=1 FL=1
MTPEASALLDQFHTLYSQLSALNPAIGDATTLAEVRTFLTRTSTDQDKATAIAVLDRFLALQHQDQGEFPPLNDYKTQVRNFRQEVEAMNGSLSADAQSLVAGKHPVAQLLRAVEIGDTFSDAQWSSLQALLTKVFGAPIAVAVSRGKLVIAQTASAGETERETEGDVFLWGDRVPLPAELTKSGANTEPPIVFGAQSIGLQPGTQPTDPTLIPLRVGVHIQNVGDREFGVNEFAGTRGKSQGIEGLSVALVSPIADLSLEYMVHIAGKGDSAWVSHGQYAGTRGENRALEGFTIRLSGAAASSYELTYSAHVQNVGDLPFQASGNYCGTRGRSLKIEGLTVRLRKR